MFPVAMASDRDDDAEERIAGEVDAAAGESPEYEADRGGGEDYAGAGDEEDLLDSREEAAEGGRVPVDLEGSRDSRNDDEELDGDGRQPRVDIDLDRGPDDDGDGGHLNDDNDVGGSRKEDAEYDAEDAGDKGRGIDLEIEMNAEDGDDVDKTLDVEAAANDNSPRKGREEINEVPDGDGEGGRGDEAGDDADDGGDKDGGMDLEIEMKEDDAIGDDDMEKALDGDMEAAGIEASRRKEREGREGDDIDREGADVEKEVEEEDPTSRPPHGSEVFVGGLPRQMEEEELKELFETVGEIFEVSGCSHRVWEDVLEVTRSLRHASRRCDTGPHSLMGDILETVDAGSKRHLPH